MSMGDCPLSVIVHYNGKWVQTADSWEYRPGATGCVEVRRNNTFSDLVDMLYEEIEVDSSKFDILMKVLYKVASKHNCPHLIRKDKDVSLFINQNCRSIEDQLGFIPLCISLVDKASKAPLAVPVVTPLIRQPVFQVPKTRQPLSISSQGRASASCFIPPRPQPAFIPPDPVVVAEAEPEPFPEPFPEAEHQPQPFPEPDSHFADPFYQWSFPIVGEDEVVDSSRTMGPTSGEIPNATAPETPGARSTTQPRVETVYNAPPLEVVPPSSTFSIGNTSMDNTIWGNTNSDAEDDSVPNKRRRSELPLVSEVLSGKRPITTLAPFHNPFEIGTVYGSKQELIDKIRHHALYMKFKTRTVKSNQALLLVVCKMPKCTWRLRASRADPSLAMFEVRVFCEDHSCSILDRIDQDCYGASAAVIGETIREHFTEEEHNFMPKQIMSNMKVHHGLNISYHKAWKSRECAVIKVRGTFEESFERVPAYLYMLEKKNPGTVTDLETDRYGRFRYMFMAIGVCITGFKSCCRPVICVDGCFLKHRIGGHMLIAIALDANESLYPLAVGVVDRESNASWGYFMTNLKKAIGVVPNLVFVSDRAKSIAHALDAVFPEAYHGACAQHLKMNLNKNFGLDDGLAFVFDLAVRAYTIAEFQQHFQTIRAYNPAVATYLEEAGFAKWSRAHFPGVRYNVLTSNYAESFNSLTRDARKYPIRTMLEHIRCGLMKWFAKRRKDAAKSHGQISTKFEERVIADFRRAQYYNVFQVNHQEYLVKNADGEELVNLGRKSCTCRYFDLQGLPCKHALAAARGRNWGTAFHLCSKYYQTQTWILQYASSIYPLGNETGWEIPAEVKQRKCYAPSLKLRVGRPVEKRIRSAGEFPRTPKRCSSCHNYGHNRLGCKVKVVAPSTQATIKASRKRRKVKNNEASTSRATIPTSSTPINSQQSPVNLNDL